MAGTFNTLITLRLLYELHNEDIQIKHGGYIQHLDYTHKSQKEYQQNYGVFWGFLDSNSSLTEKDIEVLKGPVHQKCFWSWDELKK